MFQLILPFQLELPFDARPVESRPLEPPGGASSGRSTAAGPSAGSGLAAPRTGARAKLPGHAPTRVRSKRAEPARQSASLELPIELLIDRPALVEPT